IRLGDRPRRVIGILGREFRMELLFDRKDGIYITSAAAAPPLGSWAVFPIGRLKAGVTLAQAEAELTTVGRSRSTRFRPRCAPRSFRRRMRFGRIARRRSACCSGP